MKGLTYIRSAPSNKRLSMRNHFRFVVILICGIYYSAHGQYPFLHIYLNTNNCSAHSTGVQLLDSVDHRCEKAIWVSGSQAFLGRKVLEPLGISTKGIILSVVPAEEFGRVLHANGLSRFVFGLSTDTMYDHGLDELPMYLDSIRAAVAEAHIPDFLDIDPPLPTAASLFSHFANGKLTLLDVYLDQLTIVAIDTLSGKVRLRQQQLPQTRDRCRPQTIGVSNIFERKLKYEKLITHDLNKNSSLIYARDFGNDDKNSASEPGQPRHLIADISDGHRITFDEIIPNNGSHVMSVLSGCMLSGDTLTTMIGKDGEDTPRRLFGKFVRKDQSYAQVKEGAYQESLPALIAETGLGYSFLDGIFSGTNYVFRSYPLVFDLSSGTYRAIGPLVGTSLEAATEEKKNFRSDSYYCVDAWSANGLLTIMYRQYGQWYHTTLSQKDFSIVRTGTVDCPGKAWPLVAKLMDHDHLLFIGQDHIRAWLIDL